MIHIKPLEGLKLRDPETMRLVPESGINIEKLTDYWNRRVVDGDVVIVPIVAAPTDEEGE